MFFRLSLKNSSEINPTYVYLCEKPKIICRGCEILQSIQSKKVEATLKIIQIMKRKTTLTLKSNDAEQDNSYLLRTSNMRIMAYRKY